ncbi:MAG: ABC transporter ATP-binding protein [Bacteroidetes bacterium]|nr:ABC transporter ATP-binding protein [Bacteroidota bacterium]
MLKKFISYYRPHLSLFILDMAVAIAASLLAVVSPSLTRELLKTYIPESNTRMMLIVFCLMLAVYVFKTIATYIRVRWGHNLGVRMEADMRSDLFSHLQKLSFSYYDNVKTGHIMSRITNDLNMIAEIAHHAPEDLLISIVILITAYSFMFMFSVPLALVSLIPIPFMMLWGLSLGRKMKKGFRHVREKIADINSTVENSVQGIREVKSFSNEQVEEEKFEIVNTRFQHAKEKMYTVMARYHSGMQFFREIYYFTVVAGGSILIYRGLIQVYDLVAFILYVGIVLPPIDRLINFTEQLQQGTAAFERFIEILQIIPDIQDRSGAREMVLANGEITLQNVSFKYYDETGYILKNIDIAIDPGKKTALVGESGAGKSTLVSLLPRFYEPQEGSILIDGQNIQQVSQRSLRKHIGIVQQNVFLFDATIRENILYGNPLATDLEVEEAAAAANIYDFIMSLPNGFDTEVGERGVKLSGGQKQRISIARVFLKNPEILIFDEATSSLDSESEKLIQDAFDTLAKNRTSIIIAHRLTTVRNADRICVLLHGEIVEDGTHDELMQIEGDYARLYKKNLI